ncbi:hypothetical protein C8R44DRAFT_992859 [Mycena epipterygia]|nr:hypothetical protein C8R44DRAFT_992859 [Mycena epipterygia]
MDAPAPAPAPASTPMARLGVLPGCLLLIFGHIADAHGRKRVFLAGSALLAAFALACDFAKEELTLAVLRGFQGTGGAATIPALPWDPGTRIPPVSRARAFAFASFAAGAPVGGALGMVLGCLVTQLSCARNSSSPPRSRSPRSSPACSSSRPALLPPSPSSASARLQAMWTGVAFGGLATLLVLVAFRGVGTIKKDNSHPTPALPLHPSDKDVGAGV